MHYNDCDDDDDDDVSFYDRCVRNLIVDHLSTNEIIFRLCLHSFQMC